MLTSANVAGSVILVSKEVMYTFPFGYAYLAGYLKSKNENVRMEFRPAEPEGYRDFAKKLIAMRPLLVGFGTIFPDLYAVKEIIRHLDAEGRDFPLVLGGQMVSPNPEFAISITGADIGVVGEGEITLYKIVRALRESRPISDLTGLVYRDGETIVSTGTGEFIEDLSELPPIPYDMFPADRWLHIGKFYAGYGDYYYAPMYKYDERIVPIHGGRGCPYKCNFCYHHSRPRYRSMEAMMADAEELISRYDADMLEFSDDLVIASPKRARELVKGIKKLSRPVEYSISCRFNIIKQMDDQLLRDLKDSGCRILGIGLESGSQRILDAMHKHITVEDIREGLRRIKEAGMIPITAFMVGQIAETAEDVESSLNLLRELVRQNKYFVSNFTITTPFPGSELYDIAFETGKLKTHEDFYRLYDPNKDMCGVSLNMSAMPDDDVVRYRNQLEAVYLEEKKKAFGKKIIFVEKLRAKLKGIHDRLENILAPLGGNNLLILGLNSAYDGLQNWLDRVRFKIYATNKNA